MRVAVVQLNSGEDVSRNLERAAHWIERAVQAGAEFVALPENFSYLHDEATGPNRRSEPLEGGTVEFLRDQAKRYGVVLAGGTFPEASKSDGRHFNTALLIDADGNLLARYRKIHLFDVDLADASLRESAAVRPGEDVVVAELPRSPGVSVGLSVCYDLRFPELYRALSSRGAQLLLVPSAFTVPTGTDHWEVLLRARAIENQAFVIAAAQYGVHNSTRRSYGRSMIIDPWGLVIAQVPDGEGVALADLDLARLERIRRELPALKHRRLPLP